MNFTAFFDESSTEPTQGKELIIGGFIGHIEEWERASEAWDECLHQHPSINYFSHHDATCLENEFLRFSRATAGEKVKNLARVIAQFKLQGFCASVPHSWFANRDARASRGVAATRAYDWGFLTATSGVLQFMEKLTCDYVVDFVFDERKELRACIDLYDDMKASGMIKRMAHAGTCTPGDDKKLPALQMADLLAGEHSHLRENGPPPLEPFSIIAKARAVCSVPCIPPPQMANTLAVQKLGADVRKAAQLLCKRIYGDNEKSLDLIKDVAELEKQEDFFFLQLDRLRGTYPENAKEFMEEFHRAVAESKRDITS